MDRGWGEYDEHHSAISMDWMRSMIDPYAANPDHHRKIYRTKAGAMKGAITVRSAAAGLGG